jgi:polysaccharide deacetylase 2 family uncharacterized protein YibQ
MAVEGIERLAPPIDPKSVSGSPPERLAVIETLQQPSAADAEDTLADINDPTILREDPSADVIITVDGVPARAIGAAATAKPAASWTPIAAPDASLLKRSAYGQVPRISADGRRPSKTYAQAFTPGDQPAIALIVGGLGLNRALTERAIDELPPYVTLAFAPYAKDLPFWSKRARDAGHEVMIEIPMENRAGDAQALGPAALLTTRSDAENAQRIDWILSRFEGYFGVTNYLGAKYSGDRDAMQALLSRISAAGLAYIDDTGALERIGAKAQATSVNRLIDPGYGSDKGQTKRDLQSLEKIAEREGDALGKTYINDETLIDIVEWSGSLDARDLSLAPASAVLAIRAGDR